MIETIVSFIEGLLVPYGALGVFAASFIEEVVAPIPSALVLLASGFAFLHGEPFSFSYLSTLLFVIVIPASLGMALGSLFVYGLGFISGKPAITKFGRYFGISWHDIEKAEERFSGTSADEITLFLLRVLPVVPNTAVSAFCGLIRFPVGKYLLISAGGLAVRALVVSLIGAQVGSLYDRYEIYFDRAENYILALLSTVTLVLLFVLYRRTRSKKSNGGA